MIRTRRTIRSATKTQWQNGLTARGLSRVGSLGEVADAKAEVAEGGIFSSPTEPTQSQIEDHVPSGTYLSEPGSGGVCKPAALANSIAEGDADEEEAAT